MKVITARTSEPDDKEAAFDSISEQIAAHGDLHKSTVGFMFCHYDFVFSGVAEYVAKHLPFPVVGYSTTLAGFNRTNKEKIFYAKGDFRLVLLIVSSDDIEFTPILTEPLSPEKDAADLCNKSLGDIGKQKMGFLFLPHLLLTDTEAMIDAATKETGAQIIGGFSVDDSPTYIENCFVIAKGQAYRDRGVFLFLKGNVAPHFATTVVTKDLYLDNTAIITESKGNEIISLNGRPVTEFLERLGFNLTGSKENAISSAVMIVDDGDGDTYGRSMMYLTPDHHLFVGGRVTTGATVSIAMFERRGIIDASAEITRKFIADNPDAHVAIVISCETRHIVLGSQTHDGEKMLRDELGDIPFILAYAGGEFCPSNASTPEKPVNRLFNQSYCICLI
ncbi:MAG: FIST C-terminal domain-containing protein [Ruminococcus sp.]|jgi:hypothetical protein|nr:FIST C-terminal domain-containing protein [Ruminococcus sp.]